MWRRALGLVIGWPFCGDRRKYDLLSLSDPWRAHGGTSVKSLIWLSRRPADPIRLARDRARTGRRRFWLVVGEQRSARPWLDGRAARLR